MRSNLPPLMIAGPDEPHALDNIPIRMRPDHADVTCEHCRGRGAWNELLHLDSMRCRLAICPECDGHGWKARDGTRMISDVVMRNGHAAWIRRHVPPPPILVSHQNVDEDRVMLELEAA